MRRKQQPQKWEGDVESERGVRMQSIMGEEKGDGSVSGPKDGPYFVLHRPQLGIYQNISMSIKMLFACRGSFRTLVEIRARRLPCVSIV